MCIETGNKPLEASEMSESCLRWTGLHTFCCRVLACHMNRLQLHTFYGFNDCLLDCCTNHERD